MKKLALAAAGIALLGASAPALAQNLVVNGNFEGGSGANGIPSNWAVFPGREIKAATGLLYVTNAGGTGTGASLTNTFAAFGGGNAANRSSLFSTAFQTVAGQLYRLTFDYAQFGGAPGAEVLDFGVFDTNADILLTGTKTPTATSTGTNLDTIFAPYRYNYFTGNGNLAQVYFSISNRPTINTDGLLDNVIITAVPEASTWAMMILGMGLIGGSLRQRRRFATTAA